MGRPTNSLATLVLVGGHESADGADLAFLASDIPGLVVTTAGRRLHHVTAGALAKSTDPIVVLPMTFGRNPALVADVAKTLDWLSREADGRIALADDFGTPDHLTAWLRAAATQIERDSPEAAMLVAATAANPFDDADVFRTVHLVRTHGSGIEVEGGIISSSDDLAKSIDRLHRLGSEEIVVVPAGFQRDSDADFGVGALEGVRFFGPLMSAHAVLRVVRDRREAALERLHHGQNGIDVGLQADHGHGYAHSHAFEESQGHTHSHGGAPHSHGRATHSHGTLVHEH